jgi:hypothetical protein
MSVHYIQEGFYAQKARMFIDQLLSADKQVQEIWRNERASTTIESMEEAYCMSLTKEELRKYIKELKA